MYLTRATCCWSIAINTIEMIINHELAVKRVDLATHLYIVNPKLGSKKTADANHVGSELVIDKKGFPVMCFVASGIMWK